MLHPVPFESNPKNDLPPHPGEDQNAKRAKTDDGPLMDTIMDAEHPSEPASVEALVSPALSSDFVPETQMPSDSPLAQDVQMDDKDTSVAPDVKAPSFKEKLLNLDSKAAEEEDDDIVLNHGDISIGVTGNIPTVDFANHVLETLNKKMGLAVVVKLLGRRIGYRQLRSQLQNIWKPAGQLKLTDLDEDCYLVRFQDDLDYQNAFLTGPWMVYGHYLTVQPWTPSFKPHDHVINQVIGWIRLPKLPARYYHKSVIRSIGSVFGEVIRVDYNTDSGECGKFARIAVCIDLTKPLTSKILVDGELIFVEYEGLPSICFSCGKYGHLQGSCPAKMVPASDDQPATPLAPEPNAPNPDQLAREASQFGSWMQVQRRRRNPVRGDKPNKAKGTKKVGSASRYEVLNNIQEDEAPTTYVLADESHYTKKDSAIRKKKGSQSKGPKRPNTGIKNKATAQETSNQDCLFQSKSYVASKAPSTLDQSLNSAIHIVDPRSPLRPSESQGPSSGPGGVLIPKPKSLLGNNPQSTRRGLKLSTGITIHKLGSKPIPDKAGPSSSLLKQVAREMHNASTVSDDMMQDEGVDLNPNLSL
ncbi:hypothetical protein K1719_015610 [Acacia pycnantha]|nr:hypothetical protein K1719_015610 [Acacia pycnantha]